MQETPAGRATRRGSAANVESLHKTEDLAAIYYRRYNSRHPMLTGQADTDLAWLRHEAAVRDYVLLPRTTFTERVLMKNQDKAGGPALEELLQAAQGRAFGAVFFRRLADLSDTWHDFDAQRRVVSHLLLHDIAVYSGPGLSSSQAMSSVLDRHARPGERDRLDVATRIWDVGEIGS